MRGLPPGPPHGGPWGGAPGGGPTGSSRGGSTLGLGALSGLLLALSFPPIPLPLLAFVALAPLALALERLPDGPSGARGALLSGLACGAVSWGLLLHWIPAALLAVAPWSAVPVFVLVVAGLALLTGAVARVALVLRVRGVPLAAGLPLLWVTAEWLRAALPGMELAWLPLGNALVTVPALAAPGEWVGVLGLSAWVAGVGCLAGVHLARPFALREGAAPARGLRFSLPLLLVLPALAGGVRDATLVPGPLLGVAALQLRAPGTPGRPPSPDEMEAALAPHLATAPGPGQGVDLLLLPEGTFPSNRPLTVGDRPRPLPVEGPDEAPDPLLERLAATAARVGVPLLAGGYGVGEEGQGPWNVAVAVTPDAQFRVVHRKRHLVPGVEGGSRILSRVLSGPREPGGSPPPVRGGEPGAWKVAGRSLGVLICYETAFPGAVRRRPSQSVEAFLALTHEGWFGEGGGAGSIPRAQHIAQLRMRAVESRNGIIRSAADGQAILVDPRGRVVLEGPAGGEGWITGHVAGVAGTSLHARTPPLLLPGVLALLLAALLVPRRGVTPHRHPERSS